MPFEFTGEASSFGTDPNTPNPFSFATANARASPLRSFGSTPSFGSTSTWTHASSVANPFSARTVSPSKPPIKPYQVDDTSVRLASSSRGFSSKDDRLSRSLERIRFQRDAIFSADKNADDILSTYLSKMKDGGEYEEENGVDKLEAILHAIDESHPGATSLLRHIFERAALSVTPVAKSSDGTTQLHDDAGDIPEEAPDAYHDIVPGTPLYNACAAALNSKLKTNHCYYQSHSYTEFAIDVTNLIASGATRAVVRQFLASGAYGRFRPSNNIPKDVDEVVDAIYEIILTTKKQLRNGFAIEGRDEASYFGWGTGSDKQIATMPPRYMDDDRKESIKRGLCCPFPEDDYLPHEPPPEQPFRFMDLPPELRNNIYRKVLAPGTISLISCRHYNPRGTAPGLVPELLGTCKQIHEECKGLLLENTFQVVFAPFVGGFHKRPGLNHIQLPLRLAPKVKHLVLLLDCIRFVKFDCDPDALQAFTGLKTLRIIGIEEEATAHAVTVPQLSAILEEVFIRIPADCEVEYGARPGEEARFTRRMARTLCHKNTSLTHSEDAIEVVHDVDVAKLKQAAQAVPDDVVQGWKSGQPSARRRLPGELMDVSSLNST